MFEIIAIAAVKAITSYLVTGYMKTHYGSIDIEGAPYWYAREGSDEICVSDAKNGNILELDREKQIIKIKLQKKLSEIVNDAIHTDKKFSNLKPDEEAFLNTIINDKKLKWFVNENGYYKNIKIDNDKKMIFMRMCVKKDKFINYETNRIKSLQKELTIYKSNKAFNELDGKTQNYNDNEDKAFQELDKSF